MKNAADSMSPEEAAQAFFGQNDEAFAEMIGKLTKNDPRLVKVFEGTRQRFLQSEKSADT